MGSKSVLLRALVATSSAKTADFGVPSFVPEWRPNSGADHFEKCPACGHLIDCRDLAEVMEHVGPHQAPHKS